VASSADPRGHPSVSSFLFWLARSGGASWRSSSDLARLIEQQQLLQLELARATAALEVRTVRSPIQGVVIEKSLSAGEYVSEASHIVTISSVDPLYVETFLPVQYFGQIAEGQTVTVETDAPLSGRYRAQVLVVDRMFDAASSTFGVRLKLPNPGGAIPAGLKCKVSFGLKTASAAPHK
jgi:multidrug efflux pump subunit AcrA (membrane-fusion protein)